MSADWHARSVRRDPHAARGHEATRRVPTPPPSDDQMTAGTAPARGGVADALASDRRATLRILALRLEDADRTSSDIRRALTTVISEIHARLHSPIHPRIVGREQLVHTLIAGVADNVPVTLRIVLAAPSAERELPGFLELARALQGHLRVRLEPLLVRWSDLNHPISDHEFQRVAASLHTMLAQGGNQATLELADIRAAATDRATIDAPIDVAAAQQEVTRAIAHGTTDQRLLDDLAWIHTFHTRHDSLSDSDSHPDQPLLDLAIRRAIGRRLSAGRVDNTHTIAATSEPHRRFLPCYATSTTILNLRLT